MKFKIVIVDWEIPPRVKRCALRLGIPAAVLGAAAVAFAAVPKTWNSGDQLTASDLNANFAAIDARLANVEKQKVLGVTVTGSSIYAGCSSSPCAVSNQFGVAGPVSVTRSGPGQYNLSFGSTFSASPTCVVTALDDHICGIASGNVPTAGQASIYCVNWSNSANTDDPFSVICLGQ